MNPLQRIVRDTSDYYQACRSIYPHVAPRKAAARALREATRPGNFVWTDIALSLANKTPTRVAYWVWTAALAAYTTGPGSHQIVHDVSAFDVMCWLDQVSRDD